MDSGSGWSRWKRSFSITRDIVGWSWSIAFDICSSLWECRVHRGSRGQPQSPGPSCCGGLVSSGKCQKFLRPSWRLCSLLSRRRSASSGFGSLSTYKQIKTCIIVWSNPIRLNWRPKTFFEIGPWQLGIVVKVCKLREQVVDILPYLAGMADNIHHIIPEVVVVKKCGGETYLTQPWWKGIVRYINPHSIRLSLTYLGKTMPTCYDIGSWFSG